MPRDDAAEAKIAGGANRPPTVDQDEFLPLYATYQKVLAEEAEVKGRKKRVRKEMQAAGVKLGVLDAQIKLAELPLDEMRDHLRQEQEIRRYLKAPIGHQFGLFGDDAPDPLDDSDDATAKRLAPIIDDARAKGFLAGISGREADNPHDGNTEAGLAWQGAWAEGRAVFDKSPEPMSDDDEGDEDEGDED